MCFTHNSTRCIQLTPLAASHYFLVKAGILMSFLIHWYVLALQATCADWGRRSLHRCRLASNRGPAHFVLVMFVWGLVWFCGSMQQSLPLLLRHLKSQVEQETIRIGNWECKMLHQLDAGLTRQILRRHKIINYCRNIVRDILAIRTCKCSIQIDYHADMW